MQEILKEKGYKVTPARLAILDVFMKTKLPLTAEAVWSELKKEKKHKGIDEATVYRTLSVFEQGKILKRIDFRKESAYFELGDEHHHHITCIKCETIEDFHSNEVEKALGRVVLNSSKFMSADDHSLELFGVCKNCS